MVKSLLGLREKECIRADDPIVIYYAGHGGSAPVPPEWEAAGGKMQFLVPHDFGKPLGGDGGKNVEGITDRAIAVILDKLAAEKGNNIVSGLLTCLSL